MELPRDPDGRWWTVALVLDEVGGWRVSVQLASGKLLTLHLAAAADPAEAIPAGVEARIRRDVRWTKRSDRGGEA